MKGVFTIIVSLMAFSILLLSGKEVLRTHGSNIKIIYKDLASINDIQTMEFDCDTVKPVVYRSVVSLEGLTVDKRKAAFIKIVLPSILIARNNIEKKRKELLQIREKISRSIALKDSEFSFLSDLSEKYRTNNINELLSRLNTHPPSIILAQAALESGWGSSRFFEEGNNIFGTWTFDNNSGIKAIKSEARLSRYDSTLQAVEDYLFNINVGWAYKDFRKKRTDTSHSLQLIKYLDNYSVLREEYVRRLNNVIRSTNLEIYDTCRIDPAFIY
ncbi:MAG TPA: mannosyl-glycoprotein endo-beta-N-acetylglucosamidase [Nitrospirae bacterium]|nr:mannosyl-glycoprotein endo-beta-N-acetylglucosamidase [Nitrospirota bacterium]